MSRSSTTQRHLNTAANRLMFAKQSISEAKLLLATERELTTQDSTRFETIETLLEELLQGTRKLTQNGEETT